MNSKKRIIIVGATSSIAKHCARLWVTELPVELFLLGRDAAKLERVADDLRVRGTETDVHTMQLDFLNPAAIQAAANDIASQGCLDIVLIAHGNLPEQKACENDLTACRDALEINAISPVLFAQAFAGKMAETNHGTLAIIGSVAGDRGRKTNYIYGAAKGLVERCAQGMQHRFAGSNVKIVLIKPGPTDTPMTRHLQQAGAKLARVEAVAREIVTAIEAGKRVVYVPAKGQLIMEIIRHLPAFVFNKLNI